MSVQQIKSAIKDGSFHSKIITKEWILSLLSQRNGFEYKNLLLIMNAEPALKSALLRHEKEVVLALMDVHFECKKVLSGTHYENFQDMWWRFFANVDSSPRRIHDQFNYIDVQYLPDIEDMPVYGISRHIVLEFNPKVNSWIQYYIYSLLKQCQLKKDVIVETGSNFFDALTMEERTLMQLDPLEGWKVLMQKSGKSTYLNEQNETNIFW